MLEFPGLGFGGVDKVFQGLERGVGPYGEHRWLKQQACNRCQVSQCDGRLTGRERVGDPDAGDEAQRMRIAFALRHGGRRYSTIATSLVEHLHPHRQQFFFFKHLGNRAGQQVIATARPGVDDDIHSLRRFPLRRSRSAALRTRSP